MTKTTQAQELLKEIKDYTKDFGDLERGSQERRTCEMLLMREKAKLSQFKQDAESELEVLKELIFMDDLVGCDACIISNQIVEKRIKDLKSALEVLG